MLEQVFLYFPFFSSQILIQVKANNWHSRGLTGTFPSFSSSDDRNVWQDLCQKQARLTLPWRQEDLATKEIELIISEVKWQDDLCHLVLNLPESAPDLNL